MELKTIDPQTKAKMMSLCMEIGALQISITDNIFKISRTEGEAIDKLKLFRKKMTELAEDLVWKQKKN